MAPSEDEIERVRSTLRAERTKAHTALTGAGGAQAEDFREWSLKQAGLHFQYQEATAAELSDEQVASLKSEISALADAAAQAFPEAWGDGSTITAMTFENADQAKEAVRAHSEKVAASAVEELAQKLREAGFTSPYGEHPKNWQWYGPSGSRSVDNKNQIHINGNLAELLVSVSHISGKLQGMERERAQAVQADRFGSA